MDWFIGSGFWAPILPGGFIAINVLWEWNTTSFLLPWVLLIFGISWVWFFALNVRVKK